MEEPVTLTFAPEWMAANGIKQVASLAVPGRPMLLVEHEVGGVLFRFMAFIWPPDATGEPPTTPEAILAQAEKQILRGIVQRRASLVGSF